MKKVITLNHEYGSGSRDVAKQLAEKLGYNYYDSSTMTEAVARESGYSDEYLKEHDEEASAPSVFLFSLNNSYDPTGSNIDKIFFKECAYIKEKAKTENCIIVGHCSDYVLKNEPDVFHIFLLASPECRLERINNVYHENITMEQLKRKDKKRVTYYRYYTDRKVNDVNNYNLTIDRTNLTDEELVEILYNIIKAY